MKLLYTNFHSGSGGGHTTYIRELARGLAQRHDVHVAVPGESRLFRETQAFPNVSAFAQTYPNGLRRWRARQRARARLHAYLAEHRFDIVHVNGSADHRLVMAAVRGLKHRPRIVVTKHNTKSMVGLQHLWRARFGTDKAIAVCDYVLRQLHATPYRRCDPETVHNGVDTTFYSPPLTHPSHRDGVRLRIGSNAGTADYKGWTDLVSALMLLSDEDRRRVDVIIAGHPPSQSQHQLLEQSGLREYFHFPGMLDDVRPMIASLDAGFVLSYDVETISFACREMMAMGKPVMVTNYAGLPENVRDGEDGWVVPVHDHEAMAKALRSMLEDREDLWRRGRAAREHAVAEFGIERFIRRTENIYLQLLASPESSTDPGSDPHLQPVGTSLTERGSKQHRPQWSTPPSTDAT
ncbi:glycosyltransferase family 4 protein [Pseudoxanthomonas sp. PXM01]|uniref:glycosyltransferase family 4 protein n=1 Tax=Pseudoxanthomonas sp. PXM01 TaxID=2769295 RepID=UPI00178740AB|nr:glycosyltransferase family 4 protein [Pseudoxanthomonas sp. PXM01]MBD9469183.1 glycosyltransferase family 4 protein [Pseudoxanthomonas sp. PXM01]